MDASNDIFANMVMFHPHDHGTHDHHDLGVQSTPRAVSCSTMLDARIVLSRSSPTRSRRRFSRPRSSRTTGLTARAHRLRGHGDRADHRDARAAGATTPHLRGPESQPPPSVYRSSLSSSRRARLVSTPQKPSRARAEAALPSLRDRRTSPREPFAPAARRFSIIGSSVSASALAKTNRQRDRGLHPHGGRADRGPGECGHVSVKLSPRRSLVAATTLTWARRRSGSRTAPVVSP